jgi:hypothetical protein
LQTNNDVFRGAAAVKLQVTLAGTLETRFSATSKKTATSRVYDEPRAGDTLTLQRNHRQHHSNNNHRNHHRNHHNRLTPNYQHHSYHSYRSSSSYSKTCWVVVQEFQVVLLVAEFKMHT